MKNNKRKPKTVYWYQFFSSDKKIRKPNSNWRLYGASLCLAEMLDLPPDPVVFKNPDRTVARSDKTLGALRKDWKNRGY